MHAVFFVVLVVVAMIFVVRQLLLQRRATVRRETRPQVAAHTSEPETTAVPEGSGRMKRTIR